MIAGLCRPELREWLSAMVSDSLRDVPQPGNAADRHPFDDKDIAVGIERRMVRVDKPPRLPGLRLVAKPLACTRWVQASS